MAPLQGKTFAVSNEQLAEMCDVLFQGIDKDDDPQGRHGFVVMSAGDKGRCAVEAVFPSKGIKWRYYDDNVWGWAESSLNLPDVIGQCADHRVPLEITRGVNLDEATADALAFLMCQAVIRQGVIAGYQERSGQVIICRLASATH